MDTRSKVCSGSKPLKKAMRAAKQQCGHPKISNFPACKAQGNQHEIRIAFFEHDNDNSRLILFSKRLPLKQLWTARLLS